MRRVLLNHVNNRLLKPVTTKDTVALSIQELQQMLPSLESITNLKRLSRTAEFASRRPVPRSYRNITDPSTAMSARAKEAIYRTKTQRYEELGLVYYNNIMRKYWCETCHMYIGAESAIGAVAHIKYLHQYELTVAALAGGTEKQNDMC
jgi:hypothetical protein